MLCDVDVAVARCPLVVVSEPDWLSAGWLLGVSNVDRGRSALTSERGHVRWWEDREQLVSESSWVTRSQNDFHVRRTSLVVVGHDIYPDHGGIVLKISQFRRDKGELDK